MSLISGTAFWNLIAFIPVAYKPLFENIGNQLFFKINTTEKYFDFDIFIF